MTVEFRCLCCGTVNHVTVVTPQDTEAEDRLARDAFRLSESEPDVMDVYITRLQADPDAR